MHLLRRRRARALLAAVIVVLVAAGGAPTNPVAAYPSSTVDFEGRGWGHGRGMGQYGALGYAVNAGWSHTRILDHYYGGTTMGTQPDGEIDVRLIAQDGADLLVTSPSPFTVGSNTFGAGEAALVQRSPSGELVIHRGDSCGGPWTVVQVVGGDAQPEARPATLDQRDDLNQMLALCRPGEVRHYRGTLRLLVADGATRTLNRVRMESYLRGVVPRESPASWGDLGGGRGAEALKAQAVAARSYAWGEGGSPTGLRYPYAKTCDTVSCQVYGGAGLNGALIEDRRTNAAVDATAGQVRRHSSGAVARTEFSSSTGGYTAGGTFPAVRDDGDVGVSPGAVNPNHTWRASVPVSTVEARYPQLGTLVTVDVTKRNGLGADGGRVLTVVLRGTRGSVTLTGNEARSGLGLKSDWFTVIPPPVRQPMVGIAATPGNGGYWMGATDGTLLAFGNAADQGSPAGLPLNQPIVGIAATPDGGGYWFVARDGGIFSYGNARFFGSTGGIRLNQPIVGMASTPTGRGYWLVASDGGIFAYGDAGFFGSTGAIRLNQPVVGMAPTPSGQGYWLVARDGGIFAFGDAGFFGSTGSIVLNQPIVGMASTPHGGGYWFVAADGGIFNYGTAGFHGSTGGSPLPAPVVGMVRGRTGHGYRLGAADGRIYDFGEV